jgi:hypothetical protein
MRNLMIMTALGTALLATQAGDAAAGGEEGTIGVGGEFTLLGVGGLSVNYDAGMFHAGGFLGYSDADLAFVDAGIIDIGGRFFYHVHDTAMSDFSVGGQVGIRHFSIEEPADDETDFTVDLGGQIRAFIVPNVAISATLGLGLVADDGEEDGFVLTSDITGICGIHYYFTAGG